MSDPFATNDQPTDPWAEEPAAPAVAPDSRVSVTLKHSNDFRAPWIVLEASTPERAKELLREALEIDLPNAAAVTAEKFWGTAKGGDGASAGRPQRPQQQGPSLPPGVEPKSCQHGDMVYRTGNGQYGPWKGFFCPTPKGTPGQCKAIFLKD